MFKTALVLVRVLLLTSFCVLSFFISFLETFPLDFREFCDVLVNGYSAPRVLNSLTFVFLSETNHNIWLNFCYNASDERQVLASGSRKIMFVRTASTRKMIFQWIDFVSAFIIWCAEQWLNPMHVSKVYSIKKQNDCILLSSIGMCCVLNALWFEYLEKLPIKTEYKFLLLFKLFPMTLSIRSFEYELKLVYGCRLLPCQQLAPKLREISVLLSRFFVLNSKRLLFTALELFYESPWNISNRHQPVEC